ncbi:hypothetical protein ACFPIJ_61555 [Dactylosporangium cerinum]|uniref:Uncharacterized protein n=1 Tax=Dactylosporangium cerinum TaxID=1434730 RepID=A0ABV9WHJ2_9ACTN
MFGRRLVKRTYEEKGLLLAELARQNKQYQSLHGNPVEVLETLRSPEPPADLIIWSGPTLLTATEDERLDILDLCRDLLRPGGALLIGVPATGPAALDRLEWIRRAAVEVLREEELAADQDGAPYRYLWLVRD